MLRVLTLTVLSLFCCVRSIKLPPNFPVCKLDPKELPECFARAVEDTLKILKDPNDDCGLQELERNQLQMRELAFYFSVGSIEHVEFRRRCTEESFRKKKYKICWCDFNCSSVPELGLPPIDPIEVESLQFKGGSGNIVLNQNLKNVKIFNMPSAKVTKAEINIVGHEFNNVLHTFVPEMKLTADCELVGKILLLPIRGNGKLDMNIYNITTIISMNGGHAERKGITYLTIDNTTCTLTPGLVKIHFDNLFNGEKTLGDNVNRVLNDNWKEVFSEFKDAYEEVLGQYVHNIAGQVFNKVPLKDLFPAP